MKRNILLAGAAAFVLAASALTAAYFYIPGGIRPTFEEGTIRVCLNDDGSIELYWPEAKSNTPEEVLAAIPTDRLTDTPEAFSGQEGENASEEAAALTARSVAYDVSIQESGGQPFAFTCHDTTGSGTMEGFSLPMTVQVRAETWGMNLLGFPRRASSRTLKAEIEAVELSAPEAAGTPAPGSLSLRWKLSGPSPDLYEVFTVDEENRPHHATTTGAQALSLTVGRTGDVSMPAYGHPLRIQVRAGVQREGYVLCGPASNQIAVERQDLLGDDLHLVYQETEPRIVHLEWDETRGEYYEVQEWDGEGWTLLDTLEPAEHFVYELGRLRSGSHHRLQVAAKDRSGIQRSAEEVEFFASIDPLYATVWPIIDQPYYEEADTESASLGKIPGGTALCVLEEAGDWFQVRYKDQYGYVDSRFCMINLPEYVGDHCSYDITNSYESIFKVHENPLALITDQVITGFEHVQEADGNFLVPYLYPCSKKLLAAAQLAEADGYRLKIYEAFRPNEATRFLYDTTAAQLDWAALVYDEEGGENEDGKYNALDPVTGWVVDLADGLLTDPETDEKLSREDLLQAEEAEEEADRESPSPDGVPQPDPDAPLAAPAEPQEDAAAAPEAQAPSQTFVTLPQEGVEGEGGLQPAEPAPGEPDSPAAQPDAPPSEGEEGEAEPEPEYDTYFKIMTDNGRFRLGSFLAQVTSAHNRGIALDLTLEEISGGRELEMQSAIHDLSWYSATYRNNDNAKLLEKYMTGVGMHGLTSEWWHFQDNETRESIGLSSYLFKGVDMGGWTRDDRGWRYRDLDGSIFKNTTVTADGKRWTLDSDGYVVE